MKKKILSQLFIVSFAFAGLFLVGNNVRGVENPPGDSGPGVSYPCSGTHAGIGNGYRYCPTCEWVENAHPDSWTSGRCS
ncbi:MAG: hypothetical protein ACOCXH_06610 [Cyclobacteriaceae bacterium]